MQRNFLSATTFTLLWATLSFATLQAQEMPPAATRSQAPLTAEQVVKKMEEQNQERAAALRQFEGKRTYRASYRGFLGSRDAEMVVSIHYRAPDDKQFTVLSESGSKFIINHVFKKLLESEKEAADKTNRRDVALTSENYDFSLADFESTRDGAFYVLNTKPKSKSKFLYKGKIWVNARDFAVARIEAVPAKNPSFWIKKTEIQHLYKKVNDFWLPAENHTESHIRLGGKATLSIDYTDYNIEEALPLKPSGALESAAANSQVQIEIVDTE